MKLRWVLLAGLMTAVLLVAVSLRDRTPLRGEYCVADVGGVRAQIDLEQAQWSGLMAAQAQARGLPPRATTIAIATAFQESKIRNIDYGDRDSLGLFQQRPSQGWGTPEQVMDPVHAVGRFYEGLVEVEDYASLEITDAAQQVQRSAYPEAYAQHEPYARALASALRGFSPASFTCQLNPRGAGDAENVQTELSRAFGEVESSVVEGDVVLPVGGDPEAASVQGWSLAHYLVANAERLKISSVTFDGRAWTVEDSPDGWVPSPDASAGQVVASTR